MQDYITMSVTPCH